MLRTPSFRRVLLSLLIAVVVAAPAWAADQVNEVRLYALDCGRAEFKDMGFFSDTGEYDGKPGALAVPCFLVRHAKGTLLWDAGLGDKLADNKDGVELAGGIRLRVPVTLAEQLKTLSLAATDVTHVAFSHFHFDHTPRGSCGRSPGGPRRSGSSTRPSSIGRSPRRHRSGPIRARSVPTPT